jgi:hypothetical protein
VLTLTLSIRVLVKTSYHMNEISFQESNRKYSWKNPPQHEEITHVAPQHNRLYRITLGHIRELSLEQPHFQIPARYKPVVAPLVPNTTGVKYFDLLGQPIQ